MSSKDSPCKNCDERYCGCHSKCEKYTSFDRALKEERERRIKAIEFEWGFVERNRRLKDKMINGDNHSKIIRPPKR